MRFFHFSEQPYPEAWDEKESLRIVLPNRRCDPKVASDLYSRYLDEFMLADSLGFNIMLNEHHSTATCLAASTLPLLSILARQTQSARLLTLGVPIANRPDPLRVAEELAMIDVISKGRLEMGFVKGVPYEIPLSNLNPVRIMERFWEAHDLILKALSTTDGPFSWEGEFYQYRNVNIWPRPFQQPRPPSWMTTLTPSSAPAIAAHGHVVATVLTGFEARKIYDSYRDACKAMGQSAELDRFAYLALMAIGHDENQARRRGEVVLNYLRTSSVVAKQFKIPPGYFKAQDVARMVTNPKAARGIKLSFGGATTLEAGTLDELIDAGVIFCGTPDQVFDQMCRFNDAVGGVGNMMLMGQAAQLSHVDTCDSLSLFAKEVMPRMLDRYDTKRAAA